MINTSCEAIKHQSTITRFGDYLDKKGIGITPDPFRVGTYNLQLISALRPKGLGDETTLNVETQTKGAHSYIYPAYILTMHPSENSFSCEENDNTFTTYNCCVVYYYT